MGCRQVLLVLAEVIVTELNMFLRGWAGYFRYGSLARVLGQVGNYALWRLGLWLSKRGNRRHGWRWGVTQVLAIARPPGPGQPPSNRHPAPALPGLRWGSRMPPVKNVGKPVRENRMHGLTGGDWKRGRDQRKPRQSPTLPFRAVSWGGAGAG